MYNVRTYSHTSVKMNKKWEFFKRCWGEEEEKEEEGKEKKEKVKRDDKEEVR